MEQILVNVSGFSQELRLFNTGHSFRQSWLLEMELCLCQLSLTRCVSTQCCPQCPCLHPDQMQTVSLEHLVLDCATKFLSFSR